MRQLSDISPSAGTGNVARARLAHLKHRPTAVRPVNTAPDTSDELFLRVFDARQRLVDPDETLPPGRYRIEATAAFAAMRFAWTQDDETLFEAQGGQLILDLRRGESLALGVTAYGPDDASGARAVLRLAAEAVEDTVDLLLFDVMGRPLDARRELTPGLYRVGARGGAVERLGRSWRVNGEPWGNGSDIAVPVPLGPRERRHGKTEVEFGLYDVDGLVESVRMRLQLAQAYRFDPQAWLFRQVVTFIAMLAVFSVGAVLFTNVVSWQIAATALLLTFTSMFLFRQWRIRTRAERAEIGASLWPVLLGGGLTLMLLSTGGDRLEDLLLPAALVSGVGLLILAGWASAVRPAPVAMRRELGAFGMMLLAVMVPMLLFDPTLPLRPALLGTGLALVFALGWFGYIAGVDHLDDTPRGTPY